MPLQLPQLDTSDPRTLPDQIAEWFADAIAAGRLRAGDRLPTIRGAAEQLGVTRTTVQEAYRRLADRGLVAGAVGRGTTVAGTTEQLAEPFSPFAAAALQQVQDGPSRPGLGPGAELVANFADLQPDHEAFPVSELAGALNRALEDSGGEVLSYGHPGGLPALRETLAARDGEPGGADHVLITSGAQQAIDLAFRTFTSPGDSIAVPVPTYQQLFGLFKAQGLRLESVRSDADGPDLDDLRRVLAQRHVRLLCLMPTFHNPTGRTLSVERRRALMEVVSETRVPVLEDEYERELRFTGDPLPSLRSLDDRGLTVTVRTFSKGLFPGIRIGWVQADPQVLAPMAAIKRFMDLETSPLLQAGLREFIESGAFDGYLERLRASLRDKHRIAREALAENLPQARWPEPEGGFAFWVELPEDGAGDRVAALAAQRGVVVTPGSVFYPQGTPSRGFRLSLSRAKAETIEPGIRILGECAQQAPALQDQPPLFL